MERVIVIGSGGHAKVVIDILHEMKGVEIIGVTSNSLTIKSSFCGFPVIGDDDVLKDNKIRGFNYVAMGLGGYKDNTLRKKVFNYVKNIGLNFVNVVHPSAIISRTAKLGEGVVIFPGVVINTDVIIGNNTIIATGSTIDHETVIGNNVLVSAGVTIGAYSHILEGVVLALGAKVISGVTIGPNSLIAAGAVVISDIGENKKVFGVPAKEK